MKQTIIVLEDDPDIANLIRYHLHQAGFGVYVCSSGDTVLAQARENAATLFLLDIMVPGSNGLEVCRRIRESRDLASLPVIFLTAKSSEEDRVRGLDLGADDYIVKPFSPRELAARVRLHFLGSHPGRVFTRDQVLDSVWRETSFVTPRSVDVYVRRLREKIEEDPENPKYLKTVRGAGYKFEGGK